MNYSPGAKTGALNEAVLQAIEEHALTPEAIEHVIQLTERDDVQEKKAELVQEQKDNANRLKNLGDAVAMGSTTVMELINPNRTIIHDASASSILSKSV